MDRDILEKETDIHSDDKKVLNSYQGIAIPKTNEQDDFQDIGAIAQSILRRFKTPDDADNKKIWLFAF